MEFFWQEYWSGLPFASQGACPNPGIEPTSVMSPALAGGFFTTSVTWEAHHTTEQIVSSDLLGPQEVGWTERPIGQVFQNLHAHLDLAKFKAHYLLP